MSGRILNGIGCVILFNTHKSLYNNMFKKENEKNNSINMKTSNWKDYIWFMNQE